MLQLGKQESKINILKKPKLAAFDVVSSVG